MGDRDLSLDPDQVMEIASATRSVAAAVGGDTGLEGARVTAATFGGVEAAAPVVEMHAEAHRVVRATLRGVREDLENFATGLERAVQDLVERDDAIEAALTRITGALPFGGATPPLDVPTTVDEDAINEMAGMQNTGRGDEARQAAIEEGRG
jgi:hypothetical protein